jgi:hypothetical protein
MSGSHFVPTQKSEPQVEVNTRNLVLFGSQVLISPLIGNWLLSDPYIAIIPFLGRYPVQMEVGIVSG